MTSLLSEAMQKRRPTLSTYFAILLSMKAGNKSFGEKKNLSLRRFDGSQRHHCIVTNS
jgi:hypothetical protein